MCLSKKPSTIFILIYFCIHIFTPSVAFADEMLAETGSTILPSDESLFPLHVVINEVMWMGTDISTADEWVEIAGLGGTGMQQSRSLSGWTLSIQKETGESVIARFPEEALIGSGQYLVVSNYTKAASRLAADPLFTSTTMSLPNTKLLLRLRDAQGLLVDEVDDYIGAPFAGANPSGGGPKASMERIDARMSGTLASNWRTATDSSGFDAGTPIFGTPGFVNSTVQSGSQSSSQASLTSSTFSLSSIFSSLSSSNTFSSVPSTPSVSSATSINVQNSSSSIQVQPSIKLKINELLPDPKGPDTAEWIELYNEGSDPVNLSGMTIRVGTSGHRIRTASGLSISSGSYVLIPKTIAGFSLTNNGATVRLESGSTVLDTFIYASFPEEVSAGRTASGSILPFCVPTPGRTNELFLPDPELFIESGTPVGHAPVTLNLGVRTQTGSLASASCRVSFSDGYSVDSCNPSAHSIKTIGNYHINLELKDYCGNTVIRSLTGSVLSKNTPEGSSVILSTEKSSNACIPSTFSGIALTELLPNPTGEEQDGEWIEIRNTTPQTKSLCGWSVDDGMGGSKPFHLSRLLLPPESFLLLPRNQTKIALNNDHDLVRLIQPLPQGGTGVYMSLQFNHAPDNQSYAVDADGSWSWTPFTTPGDINRFQAASEMFQPSPVRISAAFPNPKGVDTYDEWIELTNTAVWPIWLNGWSIRNSAGKELDLTGTVLSKIETKRILLQRLKYVLGNESETLYLVDNQHTIRSLLSWKSAKEEVVQKPYSFTGAIQTGVVRQILDEKTVAVQTEKDEPGALKVVSLAGIALPQSDDSSQISIHNLKIKDYLRALIINKKVDLQFDTYKENSASVFVNGLDIQQDILVHGLAYVSREYPVSRAGEYIAFEELARDAGAGLWKDQMVVQQLDERIAAEENWRDIRMHGLTVKADTKEGIIASGSLVHFGINEPAVLYLSVNNSPFTQFSGSILVASNQTVRAFAEAKFDTAEPVRSVVIEKTYIVDTAAPKRAIRISEAYPSPAKGETEWIELENRTGEEVSLAGWMLDDTGSGGSAPWRIPADITVPAYGYRIFPKAVTGLALNNGGDAVTLLYPSGTIADVLTFGSVKTGRAVAWSSTGATVCMTELPTPLSPNICFMKNKKVVQKKSKKKGVKPKATVKKIMLPSTLDQYQKAQSGIFMNLKSQILSLAGNTGTRNSQKVFITAASVLSLMGISLIFSFWFFRKRAKNLSL